MRRRMRNAYKVLARKPEEKAHFEDVGAEWRRILKWISD
jgi:hypothetical protein